MRCTRQCPFAERKRRRKAIDARLFVYTIGEDLSGLMQGAEAVCSTGGSGGVLDEKVIRGFLIFFSTNKFTCMFTRVVKKLTNRFLILISSTNSRD